MNDMVLVSEGKFSAISLSEPRDRAAGTIPRSEGQISQGHGGTFTTQAVSHSSWSVSQRRVRPLLGGEQQLAWVMGQGGSQLCLRFKVLRKTPKLA